MTVHRINKQVSPQTGTAANVHDSFQTSHCNLQVRVDPDSLDLLRQIVVTQQIL
jgi:hypothetical protein